MLAISDIEPKIVTALENYAGCPVVLSNQTAPSPPYPYISYTITTPVHNTDGTYCMKDGVYYQPMLQTWSITAHSDDSRACQKLGMRVYDFFARSGRMALHKIGTAVSSKTNLMNRDNYLTIQYEYRCGMDVTFRMMHQLDVTEETIEQEIMHISMKQKGRK
ncbi:MAG: hypothetical protein K2H01_09300 [Ruminococcus sp.]|nr:hypothetical protein [Ruminococcus sp.]